MNNRGTTLGTLTDEDFEFAPAWEATGEIEEGDKVLVPAELTSDGAVSERVGEVWCRSTCRFANGEHHRATAMFRGDGPEGPVAWTITNDGQELPLLVPPAPLAVLKLDGPEPFSKAFGLALSDVFPLVIACDVRFATAPHERSVFVSAEGVLRFM